MHRTIALLHVILLPYIQDEIQGADVVSKALHYVFAKDRDFQDYLKSSLARHVTPTLRVRKVNVTTDLQAFALIVTAATNKDFPMLEAGVLTIGILYMVVTLVADIGFSVLNPRIRLRAAE